MTRRCLWILAALAASNVSAQTPSPTPSITNTFTFSKIRSIQARVQSLKPTWDDAKKEWVLVMPQNTNTFEERYRAVMDTVNTASPEGALMYVQTEGIDVSVDQNCMRKTNMSYIWFYDIKIVQPTFAIAQYGEDTGVLPEYGPFTAMDNGMCTYIKDTVMPTSCYQFGGLDYNANLGPYIGGEPRISHPKGNYPNNYWFSFPGSCYTQSFVAKNDRCRAAQRGGMCPHGVEPDGVACTYSFKVLGYISIDDLVGITNMTCDSPSPHKCRNRVDFCQNGNIEYDFSKMEGIPFWNDPLNVTANLERSQKMLDYYNYIISTTVEGKNMQPLPNAASLTKENPPCFKNSPLCNTYLGCTRTLMAQICTPCSEQSNECVGSTTSFPILNKQYQPPRPTNPDGSPIAPGAGAGGGKTNSAIASASLSVLLAMVIIMIVWR